MYHEDKTTYYKALLSAWQESEHRTQAHEKAVAKLGYPIRYSTFMNSIRYARTRGLNVPDLPRIETGTNWKELAELFSK